MIKKIYTKKQILSEKAFKRNVLKDEGVSSILNRKEGREFYEALKKKRDGGITKPEMREILGAFKYGKGDHIDPKEAATLSNKYLGGSRFMKRPGEDDSKKLERNNNIKSQERNSSEIKARDTKRVAPLNLAKPVKYNQRGRLY